ncbi:pentatricopeptide repeat-containing protein, putative [Ricinus communis]|uniref:Pentatricopeptide repeat-containing protein, putative n=1 Tax=Ricinus communis TaxID=3988 RepID=B9T4E5_RICCO|nr:pentatricopeptide repeat-containing protein, putative [Ricinus communis]
MIRKRTNDRSTKRQQPSSLWQNCTNLRSLKQIHASLIIKGFNSSSYALRELIFASAIVIPGTIDYAHQLFDQVAEPDIFMWNTMMRGSSQSPSPIKAVSLYTQMENCGIKPDKFTFSFLLKACTRLEWRNMGFCIHGKALKHGFQENTFVRNTLVYYHAKCGDLGIAREMFDDSAKRDVVAWSALTAGYARRGELCMARRLFDEMPVKDLVAWNVIITAYVKRGEMACARKLFNEVPRRDVVTWNAMIAGFVHCGENEQALEMFEEMISVGEQPDEVTMLSLLSACTDLGDLEVGKKVHSSILEMSLGDLSVLLGNALTYMYAKCGSIERALEVFRGMREKDVTTWNSVIVGLALHGHAEESIHLFREMQRLNNIKPNEITFVGVLVACSHAGKVEEGQRYFDLMTNLYILAGFLRIENSHHSGCLEPLNFARVLIRLMDLSASFKNLVIHMGILLSVTYLVLGKPLPSLILLESFKTST